MTLTAYLLKNEMTIHIGVAWLIEPTKVTVKVTFYIEKTVTAHGPKLR